MAGLVTSAQTADWVLLNELKVNPPGGNDAPGEFIELEGTPGALLTNLYVLALDGDASGNPGKVTYALELTGARLGGNGLLVVAATNHPYAVPAGTTLITDAALNQAGGALGNGTVSFLLIRSPAEIKKDDDLDNGNNGILEGLPPGAVIVDAIGWFDGDNHDLVYGGAVLPLPGGTPDAASRFPGNTNANSASAWFGGNLAGNNGDTLVYDETRVSSNFPTGTLLTPGALNNTAPAISGVVPLSGVIGDALNPAIFFTVSDRESAAGAILVKATSSNPAVVPDTHLVIIAGSGGARTLTLDPIGVGYSDITLWASDGSVTSRITFPYAASAPGRAGGTWHLGASDGSTAIPVDADCMLIGDDENQTLRLYRRHQSGLPLAQFDVGPYLALPDIKSGLPREVDVEASTRVGNRLFWMGSHGHAASGESRTNRTRVFATDLTANGAASTLTYAGRYDYLKLDLINWDSRNLHGKGTNYYGLEASDSPGVPPKAPDGSGFAIEGLAMMPGNTNGAYVAFRAPIVPATNRTCALIVPVLNFAAVAASTGPPGSCIFGPPIELDLYGRGIRSLEGSPSGFVLLAGSPGPDGPYPRDFRLYTWTGDPADQPQQRDTDLSGLGPEGIVEVPPGPWTTNTLIELLTDNGSTVFYGDDVKAKDLTFPNFKKCRSDLVALGGIIKPTPLITSTILNGPTLTITWRALKGETYHVQTAGRLQPPNWSDLTNRVTASGSYASVDLVRTAGVGFFRVVLAEQVRLRLAEAKSERD